ncbi:hypothetical protein D3C84_1038770 [compost metagenome]
MEPLVQVPLPRVANVLAFVIVIVIALYSHVPMKLVQPAALQHIRAAIQYVLAYVELKCVILLLRHLLLPY